MTEKRTTPRRRVLKGGKIFFHLGHSSIDCVIRNMSDTGAKLQVETTLAIPDEIELLVNQDEMVYPSTVAWRKGAEMGIRFTGKPRHVAPAAQ